MRRFKRFATRRSIGRPSRTWADVSGQFLANNLTATGAVALISLEAPANLAALTADPPEDLTLLRIVGSFSYSGTASATSEWTMALTVQDQTWTPSSTFTSDADKRILWSRNFRKVMGVPSTWAPPGVLYHDTAGTVQVTSQVGMTDIDIKPMVKIQCGQALFVVFYEESGADTVLVTSENMRVLFQRTARRS